MAALEQGIMHALKEIGDKVANQGTLSFEVFLPFSCIRIFILKDIVK